MKLAYTLLTFIAAVLPLSAQTNTTTISLAAATAPQVDAITDTTPMRVQEASEVLAASSALIQGSVDMRTDGSARTTHKIGGFETRIEIKGLSVHEIVKASLTEQDRAAGITRRYVAHLQCEAHRIWDGPMASWSEWRSSSYGFFPTSIIVEEIAGTLKARANRIADFSPGLDATVAYR
jgi:hypothetical protein